MSETNTSDNKRGRGPSNRVTDQVFVATLAVLQEKGIGNLSMEAIAERAGVHKTTLYRRWGSVNQLIKDAIANWDLGVLAFQDTGTLRTDLRSLAEQFVIHFSKPEIAAILRLIAASQDVDLQKLMNEYWIERSSLFTTLVARAAARGETVLADHFQLAIEVMVGPMLLRMLMTHQPLDTPFLDQLTRLAYGLLTSKCNT